MTGLSHIWEAFSQGRHLTRKGAELPRAARMIRKAIDAPRACRHVCGVALAAALLAVAPAHAAPAEHDEGLTVLHLSETADRAFRRDRLRAQLRVEATGNNAKQVQAEINRRVAGALERVRAIAGVKPETGGYSVYEERPPNAPARWRGSQGLTLLDRDFAELLALVGDLQNDGLVVSALAFELAPETARAAEDELTTEALKRLTQRAERIASDLHLTVTRYRDVKVGNVGGERPIIMRSMAPGAAPASPPVAEAGDAIVQVGVEAEVLLGPTDPHAP